MAPPAVKHERTLKGHEWNCSSVQFHPASSLLLSASWDRTIKVWDGEDGTLIRTIGRESHSAPITWAAWHPNGALIASTSADHTTCLWDANTGTRMRTLREHFGWVTKCSFAPDRTKLATSSWDKTVRLWDPNTGELLSTLRGHTKGVWSCAFYPVGHTSALLASCGEDTTARLWDTRTRKIALTLSGGHADAVNDIAWSADGSLIVTGSLDKTITLWDPKAGKVVRMFKGHEEAVKSVTFSSVERGGINMMATAGGYSAMLWNPKSTVNSLLSEIRDHEPGKEVESVTISHNAKLVATGGRDGVIHINSVPDFPKDEYFDFRKAPVQTETNPRSSRLIEDRSKSLADSMATFEQSSLPRSVGGDSQQNVPPPTSSLERPKINVKEAVLLSEWKDREKAESLGMRKVHIMDDSGRVHPLFTVPKGQQEVVEPQARPVARSGQLPATDNDEMTSF